jgi:predicted ATPase/DNA-binding SARP family transcriptional activator
MTGLTISVLGTAHYTRAGWPVGNGLYAKAAGLLVYLAMEADRPHGRAMLAELLWPGQDGERSRHSLRQALSTIRKVLDDDLGPPLLVTTRETIQFNRASGASIDAAHMVELAAVCERHDHPALDQCPGCVARLEELVGLYRGEFLAGIPIGDSEVFEDWLVRWQQRLRQLAVDAWDTIARWYELRGALDRASDALAHQIVIAPWLEPAYRRQMDLLWRQGKRSEALALFERCQTVLDDELGVEPEAETVALFDRIASSEAPPQQDSPRPGWSHTLPIAQGRLIGRQRELRRIGDLLVRRDCRLVTLTGPGGCGKTRLGMAVTEKQAELGVRDVHVVALAPLSGPGMVAQAIAAELGVTVQGHADARQQLLAWARGRSLFLMLDNAEHLVEDLDIVPALLQASPGIQILITSRERLQVRGEWLHDVEGLDVPGDDDARPDQFGAVELLVERLNQAGMATAADPSNADTLREICRLVDGMPLALELAAAWARSLSLEEIANHIRANLDFLATSMRDVEPRHRSMRAVFDQTWQMLTKPEQDAYCRLTVFEEGFRLDAAWAVAQANTDMLDGLVGKSLVVHSEDGAYRLHGVLRQYGKVRLEAAPENADALHQRHAQWYLGRLARWEDDLTGKDQRAALAEIYRDMGNIRAAWDWAVRHHDSTMVLASAHALWLVYAIRGRMREGEAAFGSAVTAFSGRSPGHDPDPAARMQALATSLMRQGGFLSGTGRYDDGIANIERALEMLDPASRGSERGLALNMLAAAYRMKGDLDRARTLLEESLQVFQSVHDRWGSAFSLNDLGLIAHLMHEEADAERYCDQGRTMFRAIGERRGNAFATYNLGMIAASQGQHTRAQRLFRESLALRQDSHDQWGIAASLVQLAEEASIVGTPQEAQRLYLRALKVAWDSTVTPVVLEALGGLAALKLNAGEVDEAEDLLATVIAHPATPGQLRERITALRPSLVAPASGDLDRWAIDSVNDLTRRMLSVA